MPRAVHATGRVSRRQLAHLGVKYSHPANYHEEGYNESSDLLTQFVWT